MKTLTLLLATAMVTASCSSKKPEKKIDLTDRKTVGTLPTEIQPDLVEVAQFKGQQVTGVTVANDGRMFVNFPRWRDGVTYSVMEILPDGTQRAYPDEEWNKWSGSPEKNHFTCVQSVVAMGDHLYVLDPSSPEMKGVVGKAKLFRFNLHTNKLEKTWEFDETIAPASSYLNDLRIDGNKVYITDSGMGGIIVLDMKSGHAKRLLDKHPSTKSENVTLVVNKKAFDRRIHSDGIALSPIDHKLYYHALTGYNLYRVPAEALSPDLKDETQLVKKVEKVGVTPAPDGMIFDRHGNLYMADLERNAVSYHTALGENRILIQDERINWPDTFALDANNNLIFTDSLLQSTEMGKPVDELVFKVYKVKLPPHVEHARKMMEQGQSI